MIHIDSIVLMDSKGCHGDTGHPHPEKIPSNVQERYERRRGSGWGAIFSRSKQ